MCRADARIRNTERTGVAPHKLDTLMGTAHNTVHDHLEYTNICARKAPHNHTTPHAQHANQGEQFLQCTVGSITQKSGPKRHP